MLVYVTSCVHSVGARTYSFSACILSLAQSGNIVSLPNCLKLSVRSVMYCSGAFQRGNYYEVLKVAAAAAGVSIITIVLAIV